MSNPTPTFKDIVAGSVDRWALETASPLNFGPITDEQNGPMVAFCKLALSKNALKYLDSLSYNQNFGATSQPIVQGNARLGYDPRIGALSTYQFTVTGWTADPAQSQQAMTRFKKLASLMLNPPVHNPQGHTELLDSLATHYAQLAACMDRRTLNLKIRALSPGFDGSTQLHTDDGSDYVSIAYLRGSTTPHAIPAYPDAGPDKSESLRSIPQRSMAIWRGGDKQRPSRHMNPPTQEFRLLLMCDFTDAETTPAYRRKPGLFRNLYDSFLSTNA